MSQSVQEPSGHAATTALFSATDHWLMEPLIECCYYNTSVWNCPLMAKSLSRRPLIAWSQSQPLLRVDLKKNKNGCNILSNSHFGATPGHFWVCHLCWQLCCVKTKTCSLVGRHACISCVTRWSFRSDLKTLAWGQELVLQLSSQVLDCLNILIENL